MIARKNTSTALSAEIAACHAHAFQTLTLLATISSEAFFDIRPSAIRNGKKARYKTDSVPWHCALRAMRSCPRICAVSSALPNRARKMDDCAFPSKQQSGGLTVFLNAVKTSSSLRLARIGTRSAPYQVWGINRNNFQTSDEGGKS
jgi:hypothetical protein